LTSIAAFMRVFFMWGNTTKQ